MSGSARMILAIKRKADDEPLDVLCVDDAGTATPRKKRQIFRRVVPGEAGSPRYGSPRHGSLAKSMRPSAVPAPQGSVPAVAVVGDDGAAPKSPSISLEAPRRFHMMRDRVPGPLQDEGRPNSSGKRKTGSQFLVFTEHRKKSVRSDAHQPAREASPALGAEAAIKRKRPQLSQSVRLWHQKSHSSLQSRSREASPMPDGRRPQLQQPPPEPKLSRAELEGLRWAMEMHSLNEAEQAQKEKDVSKRPVARSVEENPSQADVAETTDDEQDWVYDRYVRCASPGDSMDIDTAPLELGHGEKLGYLVIGTEDEEAWQAYLNEAATSLDDDEHLLEDDEDSNAEDYYANDYPDEDAGSLFGSASEDGIYSKATDSDYDINDPEYDVGFSDDGEDAGSGWPTSLSRGRQVISNNRFED